MQADRSSRRSPAEAGAVPASRAPIPLRWAKAFRAVLVALVYVAVAAFVLNCFQEKWGLRDGEASWGFDRMLDGSAPRPVAYRVLVPRVVAAIAALVPARTVDRVVWRDADEWDGVERTSPLLRYGWNGAGFAERLVAYLLQLACLLAALAASRLLVREALGIGGAFADFAPAVGFLLLPLTFHRGGYVYDFPELMFCAVGVLLLVRGRTIGWYACFALACLNKEADVLLAITFAAFAWRRMSFRRLVAHGALHVAVGGAILVGLRLAYAGNPMTPGSGRLLENLAGLARTSVWVGFTEVYAPYVPTPSPYNVILLFAAVSAAAIAWREKPWELRAALVGTMAVLVPLCLAAGNRDEVRNYSLAFVPFCLLACHTVHAVYGRLRDAEAGTG